MLTISGAQALAVPSCPQPLHALHWYDGPNVFHCLFLLSVVSHHLPVAALGVTLLGISSNIPRIIIIIL